MVDETNLKASQLLAHAVAALERLAGLGEQVEDEWQYVTDLRTVYVGRLTVVAGELEGRPVDAWTATAIEAVIEESGLIVDPHRAIDWLSTFPQVVLLALGADT